MSKVWFITAGRGMGTDIARAALAAGNAVVATGRNPDADSWFADSFDPTSTDPEFTNDSGESTKEEKQTQGCEKHREQENQN